MPYTYATKRTLNICNKTYYTYCVLLSQVLLWDDVLPLGTVKDRRAHALEQVLIAAGVLQGRRTPMGGECCVANAPGESVPGERDVDPPYFMSHSSDGRGAPGGSCGFQRQSQSTTPCERWHGILRTQKGGRW